jgi:hypothetical protein
MMPFDAYPHRGRRPFGHCNGDNCRHEYGLRFQRLTGLGVCAYCGLSLVDSYDHWLKMSVEPVVPLKAARELNIPADWAEDYCNMVLCCSACSEFGQLCELMPDLAAPTNFDEFVGVRDHVFAERKKIILLTHQQELAFYDSKPWASRI